MNNIERNKDYQKIVNNIFCTKKGRKVLDTDEYTLGKRERQFLLLLTNEDNVSRQLRVKLAPKISIEMMLEQGFIDCVINKQDFLRYLHEFDEYHDSEESQIGNTKTISKSIDTVAKNLTDMINPSPDVMVAAGIFI